MYLKYIIILFSSAFVLNALEWIKSGFVESQIHRVVLRYSTSKVLKFDIFDGKENVVVKNTYGNYFDIEIFCFINGEANIDKIEFQFCKEQMCRIVESGISGGTVTYNDFELEFDSNFKDKNGIKLTLKLKKLGKDKSGNYYCKAKNKEDKSSIQSSNVQIRDTIYWQYHLFQSVSSENVANINKVTPKDLPQVFQCKGAVPSQYLPSWIDIEMFRFKWMVCPVLLSDKPLMMNERMTPYKCEYYSKLKCYGHIDKRICPKNVVDIDAWNAMQDKNGSLIITNINQNKHPPQVSYMLMCYIENHNKNILPVTTFFSSKNNKDFNSGILFDGREQRVDQTLQLISPAVQDVEFVVRKFNLHRYDIPPSIIILYRSSNMAQYVWYFNGTSISFNSLIKINKYSITFSGDMAHNMEGEYKLKVTQDSGSISAIVNVKVLDN